MFHKAVDLQFKEGTTLQVTFQDGTIKQYDMKMMFEKYPQLTSLKSRKLFLTGKLSGYYGIIWNDDLDIDVETIYQNGITINVTKPASSIGNAIASARAYTGMSQMELSAATEIDQGDISRIERGLSNPTVETLERIAAGLGGELNITIDFK